MTLTLADLVGVLSRRKPIQSVMQPDMHTKDTAQSVARAGTRARLGVSQLWDIVPGECDERGDGGGCWRSVAFHRAIGSLEPPAEGNVLICCLPPRADIEIDL